MSYEIGQLDIPDRELLPARAPKASLSTEIGEAVVTHTIFGRAKVRIIRKHDNIRRSLWLTALVVVAAVAAVAGLEWVASQQGTLQNADSAPPLSASVQESAPATQPENINPPALPTTAASKPTTPAQSGIDNPAIGKTAPQPAQVLNAAGPIPAKPLRPKPLAASRPQTAPPDTNNAAPMNQTDAPPAPRPSSTKLPVTPAMPRAMLPAAQPSASSSADIVAPLSAPVVKEDASTPSSQGGNQAADTAP